MDNKELDEILKKYAESTRDDINIAFKKLNEKPVEEKRINKKFKWKYAFVAAMSAIVIVLCIALPITLTDNTPQDAPTYSLVEDIIYTAEENKSVFIDKYGFNALFPTYETNSEFISYISISLRNDESFKGAVANFIIFDEFVINLQAAIIPKTHILQPYEFYFTLPDGGRWRNYAIKFQKKANGDTGNYDMQIYFTDGRYDYFVTVNSNKELEATELLDILYC